MEIVQSEIGERIRKVRKERKVSQQELADMVNKSLRTIQKYEKGEIEISIAMINEIARELNTPPTYLIGYEQNSMSIDNLADICAFLFHLENKVNVKYDIDVKKPKTDGEWKCSITFDGKDMTADCNSQICLFLEDYANHREQLETYWISQEAYEDWKDKDLAYHASMALTDKEPEIISEAERTKRRNKLMEEQYNTTE